MYLYMYLQSKCCVKDKFNRSEFFNYDKGVRQGCILSPLLFNLYLNEFPFVLNNKVKGPILLPDGSPLNCLLHADDLLLISSSAEGLQHSLNNLSQYCQDCLLKINPTKTKVIVFQKKSRKAILTYCSEVWGVYDRSDYNSWEKDPIKKTHTFL